MKPGSRPVTSYSSTYFYLIKTRAGLGEEREGVVACCFSRGFDLLGKDKNES